MSEAEILSAPAVLLRLCSAALIGGLIGYERRVHHKAIGIAGMVLVAAGSATYMLLAQQLTHTDPTAMGRLLQGFFSGIGFLGGAVIFKGGTDVRGIKTAAAIWITGAIGLSVGTSLWWLGAIAGVFTATVLFLADSFPGTRQQIEERAELVEQRVEQAEQRADQAEQRADEGTGAPPAQR
jgi:putative Mg2+ transporter-C (MgtC) family protein